MNDLTDLANDIVRQKAKFIERELVRIIEIIEGRVPTDDEVKKYGRQVCVNDHPNELIEKHFPYAQTCWMWKDRVVLVEGPFQLAPEPHMTFYRAIT